MNPAVAPSSHSTQPADKIYPLTTQASFVSQMHICLYSHICLTMHYNTHPHGTRACLSPSSLFIPTCRHLLTCTHHIYLCTHPFVPAFVSIQVCSPISLHKSSILQLPKTSKHFRIWPEQGAISPSGEQSPDDYSGVDTAGGGRHLGGGRLVKRCPCPEQGEEKSSW